MNRRLFEPLGRGTPQSSARTGAVRVLFVCMGNICRSPTAEAVLRALARRLAPRLPIEIDSAGTHGYHIGEPPDPRAQEVARARGIDMSTLRARQLVPQDFERFDLILAMDQANYAQALALAPPARRQRLRLLLEFAPQALLREVPDPYYGEMADFEQVFDLAEQAGRGLLQVLDADCTL